MTSEPGDIMLSATRRSFLGIGGFAALAAGLGAGSGIGAQGAGAKSAAGASSKPPIKIREVKAYPVYIGARSDGLLDPPSFASDDDPRRWRHDGPFAQLPSAIITVIKTDQGVVGYGQGAGGSAAVEIIHGHLRHLLVGANPLNVEQLWDQLYSSAMFYGRRGLFTMALSSVDNALWDIAGKYAEQPVYKMIGGQPRDRIALYQSGGDIPAARAQGVRHFKLFPQIGPHTSAEAQSKVVEEVMTAREAVGPDGNLMTDCVSRNGTVEWAVGFAEQVRTAKLYFMEELLSPDDVFGYAELVQRIGGKGEKWTRVACGEHEYTEHGFNVLVRLGAAEILQPDITWCGGLTAGRRIRDLVEAAGLEMMPHRGGSVWGLPIALTSPSCTMAESFPAGSPVLDAMTPKVDRGDYLAPTAPGFGTSLSEEMVLEYRLAGRA